MAKNSKKKIIVIAISLALAVWVVLDAVQPSHYKLGMTISDAHAVAHNKLRVDGDGCVESKFSAFELREHVHFSAYDLESGEELGFNHYGVLLEIRRWKWLGINFLKLVDLSDSKR